MHECDQTAFRRQVQQRIAQWNRGGPAFSVMLVRVDHCVELIATHGPSTVELAVRATRLFLSARLREMDVFDRYDQDCFALLLPAASLDNAALLAQRVRSNATECLLPTKRGAGGDAEPGDCRSVGGRRRGAPAGPGGSGLAGRPLQRSMLPRRLTPST